MSVSIAGLRKSYKAGRGRRASDVVALDGLDISVPDEELLAVVGPSGSGKTTLLRCIAGLESADSGRIEIGGREVTQSPPWDRDISMVFQDYALYPHLSVRTNITYGLRARKAPAEEIERKLADVAGALELENVLDRRPHELSGGEQQRVALARAVVRQPRAFLMDEPLSSLDAELRARTRTEIKALQRRVATTTVYVTHDQIEAMTIGDRVAVLRDGKIEQIDRPLVVYERPANTFVARFIGSPPMNLFPASLLPEQLRRGPVAGIRSERIRLVGPGQGRLRGTTELVEISGPDAIVHLDVEGHEVLLKTPPREAPMAPARVELWFESKDLHFFESFDGALVS